MDKCKGVAPIAIHKREELTRIITDITDKKNR